MTDFVNDGGYLIPHTGIPAGDFIKPDPMLTQIETRRYILEELRRWLCGTNMSDAVESLLADDVRIGSLLDDINAGNYPEARMYWVLRSLDPSMSGLWGLREVSNLCYSICAMHLDSETAISNNEVQKIALGFIDVDRLPCGKVIRSFWNHSPFEHLRTAPPLVEAEVAETEVAEVVAEAEAEAETEVAEVVAEAEAEAEAEVAETEAEAEVAETEVVAKTEVAEVVAKTEIVINKDCTLSSVLIAFLFILMAEFALYAFKTVPVNF
jgi:hypothetical protein